MKVFSLIQRIALGLAVLWIFGAARVQAQTEPTLEIGFPYDGAVFQQEQYGAGRITMLGYFNSQAYQNGEYDGSASLTALDVRTGAPNGATSPFFGPLLVQTYGGGFFNCGFRDVPHGWYRLTVVMQPKNSSSGLPTRTQSIKVGIGEVFVIGGQSNAQGISGSSSIGAIFGDLDGIRVQPRAYDAQGGVASNSIVDASPFFSSRSNDLSNMASVSAMPNAGIGPSGPTLWLWARLGQELLYGPNLNFQVPIAFYNAGWGGTTITEWSRSTDPNKRVASFSGANEALNLFDPGQPYSLLQKTLRLYGSLYGVRAVLWQQGETDTEAIDNINNGDRWGYVTVPNEPQPYLRRVQSSDEYRGFNVHVLTFTITKWPGW
jgi:Carbohydrate esterase, sialic acid-specific acetylesterase